MTSVAAKPQLDPLNKKLREKCTVLALMISSLKAVHSSPEATASQVQLLETVIGAAIWYLPKVPQLWTGRASVSAIKLLQAGDLKGVSKDHQIPRKVAARKLLLLSESELTPENIERLYVENFGRFNLVTKAENRILMPFQRSHVFESPEKAYTEAGIKLVDAAHLTEARRRAGTVKNWANIQEAQHT